METDTHTETKALNDVAKTSLSANQGCRQAEITPHYRSEGRRQGACAVFLGAL